MQSIIQKTNRKGKPASQNAVILTVFGCYVLRLSDVCVKRLFVFKMQTLAKSSFLAARGSGVYKARISHFFLLTD